MECQDRLKPIKGRGLRVMWTYQIGQNLPPAGAAVATIGGGGERTVIARGRSCQRELLW
jgi:hypothetical protein